MLNMDTQKVTPEGGLKQKQADEMHMKANLLPSFSLGEGARQWRLPPTPAADPMTIGQRAQLDGVRAVAQDAERQHRRGL